MGINRGKILHYFLVRSTLILGMFSCHSFNLFLFCNKIFLDSYFARDVLLFLFFLSHRSGFGIKFAFFSFGLRNHVLLVVFMLMIICF
jgi:hypothetical protein